MQNLVRRGFDLGPSPTSHTFTTDPLTNWFAGKPCKIEGACKTQLAEHADNLFQTEQLVLKILDGESAELALDNTPYLERLSQHFESLGSAFNEGDEQEVETVMFDAIDEAGTTSEDLWMKVSWLSFHDEDASIRFRFSFGIDLAEDVAADPIRQNAAAQLAEAVFPESTIITDNQNLLTNIAELLAGEKPNFVERILYFNAPNGGAYLHHDLERGHAGVVYAQLTGSTMWLALPQQGLVEEVIAFIQTQTLPDSLSPSQQNELLTLAKNANDLSQALNSFTHDGLIHLINETPAFVQYLISREHYRVLNPGDAILLPQKNPQMCCWHSVFCLGEEMGQALSFAIR